jgi:glycosyltransferase involved in cell wall biosynthesis
MQKKQLANKLITIVIPCRKGEDADITLESLSKQTFQDFSVVIVIDSKQQGANWARNRGFQQVRTPYVLFSDNDIEWSEYALEALLIALEDHPHACYSYGWYELGEKVIGNQVFRPRTLALGNYISTMSLIKTEDFPGFDESITRLQDWDLWLTLLRQKKVGVYCGVRIFRTNRSKTGITSENNLELEEATKIIMRKHKLIPHAIWE